MNFADNRVCKILGIKYPVVQGGMIHIATAELAAAVSNAGGLGQIACGTDIDYLQKEIRKTRELTDKPFGVNIPLINPHVEMIVDTVINEKVKVVFTSAGNPGMFTGRLKESGSIVCHVVPSTRLAKKSAGAGVDIIVAEGWEAGGHNAYDDTTTMTLIPQVTQAVDVPVVAAGGIADSRGFVAALALGAEGVQLGTRFAATKECIAHAAYKKAILEASDTDTVVTGRIAGPVRMLKNKLAGQIIEWEKQGVGGLELLEKIGRGRSRMALIEGNVEEGSPMSGQIAGLIAWEMTAEEVIIQLVEGVQDVLTRLNLMCGNH